MSPNTDAPERTGPDGGTDRRASDTDQRSSQPDRRMSRGSVSDILSRRTTKAQLKYTLALFALVGVGLGLTGYLGVDQVAGGDGSGQLMSAMLAVTALGVALFVGPVVAVFTGLRISDRMRQTDRAVYVTSFVGNAAGYLVMVVITVVLLASSLSGTGGSASGGSFELGELFVPMILLSIPSGLVGLGSTYLDRETDDE